MININEYTPASLLKKLLIDMVTNDYSDMHITAKQKVIVESQRRFKAVTSTILNFEDVFQLANETYGSETATSRVLSGKDIDQEYELRFKAEDEAIASVYRFRVNITSVTVRGVIAPSISFRMMYKDIPIWEDWGYENEIWNSFRPRNGMILVTGPTGSGKTSLLAAGIGRILREFENEKIITLEDPIEYTYDSLKNDKNIIEQGAMGTNIHNFEEPMRSVLRRKPTIVMVGEARDPETIRAAINVASTGHLVYTTLHTNGVAQTLKRMISEFPVSEQHSRLADIISHTKMVISQQILPTLDGKKIAIREYLVITPEVKKELEKADVTTITPIARRLTEKYGKTMSSQAKKIYEQGLISKSQYINIAEEFSEGAYE